MTDVKVVRSQEGSVAVLRISNPPVNALSSSVRQQLWAHVEDIKWDPSVSAAVITGSEASFSAGADITEFAGAFAGAPPPAQLSIHQMHTAFGPVDALCCEI
jgi:enoyl-CoA hydratase/carnithine racemase